MSENCALRRANVLANHILQSPPQPSNISLAREACLQYTPPEVNESYGFQVKEMRKLLDGHNLEDRDWLYGIIIQSNLFNRKIRGGKVFVSPDYNETMEQQREISMKRILHLLEKGVFKGWLTETGPEAELKKFALYEVCGMYDYSLSAKLGVHFLLWGNAIKFFGTKRHHEKWLKHTEDYLVKGCFAMTELGHGSNVKGIETVTTYDPRTEEFVINTPCESAQKYWIGEAAIHANHAIVISQLEINETNQGIHVFIAQIRDQDGNICPNIRIADCGHKIGLNGVDNGRIWFDNLRIPRENLLNSVADVSPDGEYVSAIKNPDQRFGAFLAPLTSGRVTIASCAIYSAKVGLAVAIRYSLSRRTFSAVATGPEVLLLDYPSHQRRLLPLLAKTYAMSFAANDMKMMYVKRTPETNKEIHVVSMGLKALLTWHNMRTLQECREACGGQGVKTENRVGHLKGDYDVQTTFEGDNNVLMQQVSKALFAEYVSCKKRNKPFKGLGLEHMNSPLPVLPTQLTSSTLRCSHFQKNVFCLRERDLLERYTCEVAELQERGESRELSFLLSHQLSEDLSKAFAEKAILQAVLDAEAKLPAGSIKDVVGLVRSMYALICMEEDPSFLRYGYHSRDSVGDVRREVSKLCIELRPHALALVTSFGIPDAFLGPIAFNWIEANAWS
ncbi:PREDICTED: putative acyl-coenzyme A oxidase 3.2, peroxisomal [Brassica oleracea var. oleracea]|uniref:Acyl-coenzyme A oxidase n=1 Tax=Brassica oleracea var. oleracea TaxID=109376 RepID=A0A0D3C827_BRAOL|nr:PREDICTED: putative acyl-coenzyme A oxidase 3.2, peroxisomal [Brassica oleracea var. oleracea]